MTGGEVLIREVVPSHLSSCLAVLTKAGCRVSCGPNWVRLTAPPRLGELGTIKTMPYPGFPTDMQSVMMAAAAVADGPPSLWRISLRAATAMFRSSASWGQTLWWRAGRR